MRVYMYAHAHVRLYATECECRFRLGVSPRGIEDYGMTLGDVGFLYTIDRMDEVYYTTPEESATGIMT
jgi:hypothetical protein